MARAIPCTCPCCNRLKKSKPGARIKIKIKIKKRGRRMLPNIDDLIHDRTIESSRIEYKGDWNPEKVLRSICAFANDIDNLGGGYIIIGISESDVDSAPYLLI